MNIKDIKIDIPLGAKVILNTLKSNGYEAYVVGGCVRDSILCRKVNDWDICTSAEPEDVIRIFEPTHNVIETGIKHGTVTLIGEEFYGSDSVPYEVTTFRIEGQYSDNRHPDNVTFTNSLKEDLTRRDFTVNALCYSEESGVIDYFNGLEDLQDGIIKCVGSPYDRFSEDALRIMRAYRFASQLNDFEIEDETLCATIELKENLKNVSTERIREEINKILIADANIFFGLFNYGILDDILPELMQDCAFVRQDNPYHIHNVYNHLIYSTVNIEPKLHLRLAMLLHDICKPQCKTIDEKGISHFYNHAELSAKKSEEILRRMRYDNKTIEKVVTLIKYHDRVIESSKSIKKLLGLIGGDTFRDLLKVKEADIKAQNPVFYQERYNKLTEVENSLNNILANKECVNTKSLAINGNDLKELGIKQGKEIGKILSDLLDMVLENPSLNNKEDLINLVRTRIINN